MTVRLHVSTQQDLLYYYERPAPRGSQANVYSSQLQTVFPPIFLPLLGHPPFPRSRVARLHLSRRIPKMLLLLTLWLQPPQLPVTTETSSEGS